MSTNPTKRSRPNRTVEGNLKQLLEYLANLPEPGVFRKKWPQFERYSDLQLRTLRDELRLLWGQRSWGAAVTEAVMTGDETKMKYVDERYDELGAGARRLAQRAAHSESPHQFIVDKWLRQSPHWWKIVWTPKHRRIQANPNCLPAVLAFASVSLSPHLVVCNNCECETPYFVSRRRGQRFCSEVCALPSRRAAKLKWWHSNRGAKSRREES